MMKQRTKRIITFIIAALMLLGIIAGVFVAVADSASDYVEDVGYYEKFKGQGLSINVYNWGEYISDGSDESLDVNAAFTELTGIEVNYTNFASNEELYAKLRGGGASYDIIIPSDYMISRMIEEDMLEKLDFDNIPNFQYIDDNYKNLEYDASNEYSVPYTWGTVGIIYNTEYIDEEIDSWDILWDARFTGEILMFNNPRDAFALAQLRLGYSLNTTDEAEIERATEELIEQKSIVQSYVMDEIFDKMEGGEAALAPYYAGDALVMMDNNPSLEFVVPNEGTNLFVDAMCIPK